MELACQQKLLAYNVSKKSLNNQEKKERFSMTFFTNCKKR